jgi:nitrate reductase NapE component
MTTRILEVIICVLAFTATVGFVMWMVQYTT